jgi:hypothetical protein
MFWIPDYPNLSGKYLFQVYVAKFSDRKSCANFLRAYSQRILEPIAFLAVKKPTYRLIASMLDN